MGATSGIFVSAVPIHSRGAVYALPFLSPAPDLPFPTFFFRFRPSGPRAPTGARHARMQARIPVGSGTHTTRTHRTRSDLCTYAVRQ